MLLRHNYIIVVMSLTFCYHCVECIKLNTCTKFHDHWSNNKKVIMGDGASSPMMSNRVNTSGRGGQNGPSP